MSGSVSPLLKIPQISPTQSNKTTTINDGLVAVENATQAQIAISLASNAVSLNTAQYVGAAVFLCSGQTAAASLTVPASQRVFGVRNTGSFTITVGTTIAASGTVSVAAGTTTMVQNDGTNCLQMAAGGPGPTGPAGPAGGATLIAGSNLGTVSGTVTTQGGTISGLGTLDLAPIPPGNMIANHGTGTAVPTPVSLSSFLDAAIGVNTGAVLVRDTGGWGALAPGTTGQILATRGTAGAPAWTSPGVMPTITDGQLLANIVGGTTYPAGVSLSALLDHDISSTIGEIIVRGTSAWAGVAIGTNLAITGTTLSLNLSHANAWTAAQVVTPVTLTDGATIAVDFALSNNFEVTLGGNRTLANPTNQVKGQAGQVVVIQDATGSRTLTMGANWHMVGGGSPSWSTAAGAIDIISYYTQASGHVTYSVLNNC